MLCYAILCYAILYYTTLYYTTLYYTTLDYILYYTILYYTILYYILYYTILYTILYYTVLYYTILYTILYYTLLYYTILYTILYFTILYYTILDYTIYYTILYYTILCYAMLYYAMLYYTMLHYTIHTYICTIHKMSTDSDDTFQMSWSAEPVSCRVHCHIPFGWSSPQLEKKIWGWQRHSLRHGNTRCDVGIAEGLCFNSRKIIGKIMEIVGETDETLGSFSIRCWIGRVFSWVQVHGPRADIFRLGLAWT